MALSMLIWLLIIRCQVDGLLTWAFSSRASIGIKRTMISSPTLIRLQATKSESDATTFQLDYRGANEFIDAHYQQHLPWKSNSDTYFDGSVEEEQVRNARKGIHVEQQEEQIVSPPLHRNGFTLVQSPTRVTNFTDFRQIQGQYLSELSSLLEHEFNISSDTHSILFWNPVMRGEALQSLDRVFDETTQSIRAAALSITANMIHIDTDVGAHSTPESFLKIMYKNRVVPVEGDPPAPLQDDLVDEIKQNKRFFILNFWRNADPQNPIIQQCPLGLFLPHYEPSGDAPVLPCFPGSRPDPVKSHWYYFPNMTFDECLVFKQYDRDARFSSDVWHSALRSSRDVANPQAPRLSFDVRALVISKTEVVPQERDRYAQDRIQPMMDLEASGEFCDAQADQRQIERDREMEAQRNT